jgi:hypothetical protein
VKVKREEVLKLVIDAHLLSEVSSRYDSGLQAKQTTKGLKREFMCGRKENRVFCLPSFQKENSKTLFSKCYRLSMEMTVFCNKLAFYFNKQNTCE